jgi:hypothetical protein
MLRSCPSQSQEIRRFVSPCLPPEQGCACNRSCRNWAISRGCLFWRKCACIILFYQSGFRVSPKLILIFEITSLERKRNSTESAMVPRYTRRRRATLRCAPHLGRPPRDPGDADIPGLFCAVRSRHHPRNVPRRLRLRVGLDHVLAPFRSDPRICRRLPRHCRATHSHRRRARRAVRQGQRRPSERSRSVVELRGRANGFPCEEGWVRWRLGCKEFGTRLLSRQAIGVGMITLVASLCVSMGPNESRFPQLCEAQSRKGTGFRDYSNWLPL